MFRVCDLRSQHALVEPHIRCYCVEQSEIRGAVVAGVVVGVGLVGLGLGGLRGGCPLGGWASIFFRGVNFAGDESCPGGFHLPCISLGRFRNHTNAAFAA